MLESFMKHCLYLFLCIAVEQLWEKERSRINAIQMDNHRGLLGIRRRNRMPNAWKRELSRVMKGVDKRIDEGVLQWFGHMERRKKNRIAKNVYVREYAGSHSKGRP